MFDKMKQLMEMKKQAEQMKRDLEAMVVEVNEVNGIKITINGTQRFQSLELDENFHKSTDKEKMQADLLRSVNAAINRSQDVATQRMKEVTGFQIPGL